MSDHHFKMPEGVDEQAFAKHVEGTCQMFGCLIIQDQFSDPPWQYVVKDGIFTVRDMSGMGMGIRAIKEHHGLVEITDQSQQKPTKKA